MNDVFAYYNHGRWVVDCPKCGKLGATLAENKPSISPYWTKDNQYICPNCHPGIVATFNELRGKRMTNVIDIPARAAAKKKAAKKGEVYQVVFPSTRAQIEEISRDWMADFKNWTPGMSLADFAATPQHHSYTTPITFVALQTLTAAQLNGMQANISEFGNIFAAAGNMAYAGSTSSLSTIAKPSTTLRSVLRGTSAPVYSWGLPGLFGTRVYNSANQTVASGANILWDTEFHDDEGLHDTSTNRDRFTIVTAGRYNISGFVWHTGGGTLYWQAYIYKNGTQYLGSDGVVVGSSLDVVLSPIAIDVELNATDYVTLRLENSGGLSVTVNGTSTKSYFAIQRCGPG